MIRELNEKFSCISGKIKLHNLQTLFSALSSKYFELLIIAVKASYKTTYRLIDFLRINNFEQIIFLCFKNLQLNCWYFSWLKKWWKNNIVAKATQHTSFKLIGNIEKKILIDEFICTSMNIWICGCIVLKLTNLKS